MLLPITSLVAAVTGLLLLVTAIDTVRHRLRTKQAFGDGGDAKLVSASRSHGNLAEHGPIVIILIGLLEMAKANPAWLFWIAVVFFDRARRPYHRIVHALRAGQGPGSPPDRRGCNVGDSGDPVGVGSGGVTQRPRRTGVQETGAGRSSVRWSVSLTSSDAIWLTFA